MIQFYASDIEATGTLPADEAVHCLRVLRHTVGDEIRVVDGRGNTYRCRISAMGRQEVCLDILDKVYSPTHWGKRITLAIAPTKNVDRMEWLVEKVVEMGIDRIILLRCDHSERKIMKTDRLRKIMISAMKQSLKSSLPELEGPIPFDDFISLQHNDDDSCRLMAHCREDMSRKGVLGCITPGADITWLIGPEGDFSEREITSALQAGFAPVSLGQSRLRTETAALYAVVASHLCDPRF